MNKKKVAELAGILILMIAAFDDFKIAKITEIFNGIYDSRDIPEDQLS